MRLWWLALVLSGCTWFDDLADLCGNGMQDPGEECDFPFASPRCQDCHIVAPCGDGVAETAFGEVCDDGNRTGGDGCAADCRATTCGDGVDQAGEVCFGLAPLDLGCNQPVSALTIGDLDGDGRVEGLVACDLVHRFAGLPPVRRPTRPQLAAQIEIVELDGSPPAEIVLARWEEVSISGLASFDLAAYGLAAGDVDHDGDVDLVVAVDNPDEPTLRVLRNAGGLLSLEDPGDCRMQDPQLVDLDGDGDLDAVGGLYQLNLAICTNDGVGFTDEMTMPTAAEDLSLADLDGDGRDDLVVVAGPGLLLLGNRGDGTLAPFTDVSAGEVGLFGVADVDGDGDLDLLVGSSGQTQLNDGLGHFSPGPNLLTRGEQLESPAVWSPSRHARGDLDGDGDAELVLRYRGGIAVLHRDP